MNKFATAMIASTVLISEAMAVGNQIATAVFTSGDAMGPLPASFFGFVKYTGMATFIECEAYFHYDDPNETFTFDVYDIIASNNFNFDDCSGGDLVFPNVA